MGNELGIETSDERLIDAARTGNAGALEVLVNRHQTRLHAYLRRLLGDDDLAMDVVQDTFVAVVESLTRYDATRPFRPWLYGIANNHARMAIRARARANYVVLDEFLTLRRSEAGGALTVPDPAVRLVEEDAILFALRNVGEQSRDALLLTRVRGMSSDEVAFLQGVSAASVRQRAHRAMLVFRDAYLNGAIELEDGSPSKPDWGTQPNGLDP